MGFRSLKTKLLVAASLLVISSGLALSLLVSRQYSESLIDSAKVQAGNLAHALAMESADKVLTHDLVALQKSLDHQMKSNLSLAYLFVVRDGQVLAHTFDKGFPQQLLDANKATSEDQGNGQTIVSTNGERFIDIAWPIFEGKAGLLRLGVSEKPLERQVGDLRLNMSLITLFILLSALAGSLFFVRRITRPLGQLARSVENINRGSWDVKVNVSGQDEVAILADSFQSMAGRLKEYTQRLEKQKLELERVHNQTRTFCEIVRELGSLPNLHDLGQTLISRLSDVVLNGQISILLLNENREFFFIITDREIVTLRDPDQVNRVIQVVDNLTEPKLESSSCLRGLSLPDSFKRSDREAIVPIKAEGRVYGILVIGCSPTCKCDSEEMRMASLILDQAGGVIKRSITHEEAILNLQQKLDSSSEFSGIIGKDLKMQIVYRLIEDIAPTDATALIQGESGTGKELVAKAIHERSERSDKPFVVINCSAYPETLIESELFGHERGAFTGALKQKAGRFEQADGGTVFLDEIGEVPPQAQIKLLRVLQTQRFERLGAEQTISVNVRILAATNKNLLAEVQKGSFREDLFYRLNVIPINIPPLRERRNDIPLLARYFLKRFSSEQGKNIQEFSSEALRMLMDYSWPGNVRELENSVEHAVVRSKGHIIEAGDLPGSLKMVDSIVQPRDVPNLSENEKSFLEKALSRNDWNKKKTAQELGIGRSTLYSKLKKYRIVKPTLQ
ncbi:MAG: sigma 54-interacting transcriptional regulator [Deltaproteobacteria bacterium]|nr:sigma 54-interacting transcriptional regulator [Deltaproteobacteria bacterium]